MREALPDAPLTTALAEELRRAGAPEIAVEAVPLCPLCGHGTHRPFAEGFDYELATCRNRWRFVACERCAHVWLHPRPAVGTLGTIYPPSYYAYNYDRISPLARRGKALLDGRKMRGIVRRLARKPRAFLDVGCGNGRYLKAMERRGVPRAELYGLELDADVVGGLARDGYRALCERVESCDSLPEAHFDLITMFHVVEHIDDPRRAVEKIHHWLAPGGLFAVETPNLESLDARLFAGGRWGGYHIPRHWNLFTPATLARLATDCGLEVVGLRFLTGHSFWMYSFHHSLRYGRRPRRRLARWFDPLRSLPLLVLFTAFDTLRAAVGARTSSMLLLARRPEEPPLDEPTSRRGG